jgi:L-lysine 2,3-aminomutase
VSFTAMIDQSAWLGHFRDSVVTVAELLNEVALRPEQLESAADFTPGFKVKAPPHFRSLIARGDPKDPLLRQVLALAIENSHAPGGSKDPLAEEKFRSHAGIVRKYKGRVLVLLSGACAIHCRYCFRRHYDYGSLALASGDVAKLCETLNADASLAEVILSGGDPLSVTDDKLIELLSRIGAIDHIRTVRLHTRLPTTIPERVTQQLLDFFSSYTKKIVVVVHTNHPNEIDAAVERALSALHGCGALLLNQAVLLKGVNDAADILIRHSWRLGDCNVVPYYLHMLDPVAGAAHFSVRDDAVSDLQDRMRTELPGYLVPRFVREIPGEPYKVPWEAGL